MKLPDISNLSDKKLWVLAIGLSSISLFATVPIWLLLRKRKKENESNRSIEKEETDKEEEEK